MPVLGTKLQVPRPRRQLVARARVTGLLPAGTTDAPRLVLIAAPAGFGKTTLLTQWLGSRVPAVRVAWLSLDTGDADPQRFVEDLAAAVHAAAPDAGTAALALLDADRGAPAEDVLVSLVDDLDALPGPTVLALDDYHVVGAAGVHEAVTFLVDNLPPQVTVAMTTRADPPLPLTRLRARGELVEIRAADLRFTEAEACAFLKRRHGTGAGPAARGRPRAADRGGVCCVQPELARVGCGRSAGHMACASSVNAVAKRSDGEASEASS